MHPQRGTKPMQRIVPLLDFDALRPSTSENATRPPRHVPTAPTSAQPSTTAKTARMGSALVEQAPSAPASMANSLNTPRKARMSSSSILVGNDEFFIPPLKDPSSEIVTKFATRVSDGTDEARVDVLAGGKSKFFAAKAANNATIESWPARCPSQTLSWTAEGPHSRGSIGASEFASAARAPPKPPLLRSMEDYLARELATLTPHEQANGGRLRVYREVMRLFVENFKTYGFIISAAMTEYDRELEHMHGAVAKQLLLETSLKALKQEAATKLVDMRTQFEAQLHSNDHERMAYDRAIHDANERQEEANAIIREVADEVGNLKEEREHDLGKMLALVRAIKAADSRIKQYMDRIKQLTTELERMDDLKECLADSEARLREMTELYQDTIPRKQFLAVKHELESRIQAVTEAEKTARRLASQRGVQLDRSNRVVRQLTAERDAIRGHAPTTPRPQVDAAVLAELEIIAPPPDGCPPMTTAALLDQCIGRLRLQHAEIARLQAENAELRDKCESIKAANVATSSRPSTMSVVVPHLQAHLQVLRHTDASLKDFPQPCAPTTENLVPSYLRFVGTIPRAELPKGDLSSFFNFWWEFRKHDRISEPNIHVSFHKFFLHRNQQNAKVACAKAVNFLESCHRYRYSDSRCELLLGILEGFYPERLQMDVLDFVEELRTEMRALGGPEKAKRVRKNHFLETMGKYIDYKPQAAKEALRSTLGRESMLDVEDTCNITHPFFDLILRQGCDERIDLYTRLVEAFTLATTSDGMITHDEVENCICNVEPFTSRATVVELTRAEPLPPPPPPSSVITAAPSASSSPVLTSRPGSMVANSIPSMPLTLLLERLSEVSIARVPPV